MRTPRAKSFGETLDILERVVVLLCVHPWRCLCRKGDLNCFQHSSWHSLCSQHCSRRSFGGRVSSWVIRRASKCSVKEVENGHCLGFLCKLTCFHASFFLFCPLFGHPSSSPSLGTFSPFSPPWKVPCGAKCIAQSSEEGRFRMDLSTKFGKGNSFPKSAWEKVS